MTLTIDVTPQEEAWLAAQAKQQGVPTAEIVKRLIDAQLPSVALEEASENEGEEIDPTQALFAQWAKEDATLGLDAKTVAAIAYLDARIEEGKNATPDERQLADLEVEELKRNLNANRADLGERLVSP
jgi:hypothetical protein